jgi:hypothetical protein
MKHKWEYFKTMVSTIRKSVTLRTGWTRKASLYAVFALIVGFYSHYVNYGQIEFTAELKPWLSFSVWGGGSAFILATVVSIFESQYLMYCELVKKSEDEIAKRQELLNRQLEGQKQNVSALDNSIAELMTTLHRLQRSRKERGLRLMVWLTEEVGAFVSGYFDLSKRQEYKETVFGNVTYHDNGEPVDDDVVLAITAAKAYLNGVQARNTDNAPVNKNYAVKSPIQSTPDTPMSPPSQDD